jgi:hypothetical protein
MLFVILSVIVSVVVSFSTICISPLLAHTPPFDQLTYFRSFQNATSATPTERYHYTTFGGKIPVRIDVITGKADRLTTAGWYPMEPTQLSGGPLASPAR